MTAPTPVPRTTGFKRTGVFVLACVSVWLAVFAVTVLATLGHQAWRTSTEAGLSAARGAAPQTAMDWGAEAVQVLRDSAEQLSPIALANACGLGTSSCVRCHNGQRAPLPEADPLTAPWHQDHAKVNYSCAGCHQGNPRVLRQDVAHRNLVANPLSTGAETSAPAHCTSCHAAADVEALAQRYRLTPPLAPSLSLP